MCFYVATISYVGSLLNTVKSHVSSIRTIGLVPSLSCPPKNATPNSATPTQLISYLPNYPTPSLTILLPPN